MIGKSAYDRPFMSRLSTSWDIGRFTGRCASTGAALEPGSPCIAALVEPEADSSAPFVRLDFSEAGWNAQTRPVGVIAFWKSTVAAPDEKRRGFVDDQTLLDLFERLGGDDRTHRVRFRFVLMLLLVRKKLVRVVGTSTEAGVETWRVLPKAAAEGDAPLAVVNPKLDDDAMKEVADQLGEVLDGAW
jgi:hypothetical protein